MQNQSNSRGPRATSRPYFGTRTEHLSGTKAVFENVPPPPLDQKPARTFPRSPQTRQRSGDSLASEEELIDALPVPFLSVFSPPEDVPNATSSDDDLPESVSEVTSDPPADPAPPNTHRHRGVESTLKPSHALQVQQNKRIKDPRVNKSHPAFESMIPSIREVEHYTYNQLRELFGKLGLLRSISMITWSEILFNMLSSSEAKSIWDTLLYSRGEATFLMLATYNVWPIHVVVFMNDDCSNRLCGHRAVIYLARFMMKCCHRCAECLISEKEFEKLKEGNPEYRNGSNDVFSPANIVSDGTLVVSRLTSWAAIKGKQPTILPRKFARIMSFLHQQVWLARGATLPSRGINDNGELHSLKLPVQQAPGIPDSLRSSAENGNQESHREVFPQRPPVRLTLPTRRINLLSQEILGSIFLYATYRQSGRRVRDVYRLRLVSVQWRAVADQTVGRWSTIGPNARRIVETCITRSNNSLLHVQNFWDESDQKLTFGWRGNTSFFAVLKNQVDRIQSLKLATFQPGDLDSWLSRGGDKVERIELWLSYTHPRTAPVLLNRFPNAKEALLRHIHLDATISYCFTKVVLHGLQDTTASKMLHMITATPLLEELHLKYIPEQPGTFLSKTANDASRKAEVPCALRKQCCTDLTPSFVAQLIAKVRSDCLNSFEFRSSDVAGKFTVTRLIKAIKRSDPSNLLNSRTAANMEAQTVAIAISEKCLSVTQVSGPAIISILAREETFPPSKIATALHLLTHSSQSPVEVCMVANVEALAWLEDWNLRELSLISGELRSTLMFLGGRGPEASALGPPFPLLKALRLEKVSPMDDEIEDAISRTVQLRHKAGMTTLSVCSEVMNG